MITWLVTIGEPLPTDNKNARLLRTGILAEMLVRAGHDVLWWTSTFDHVRKRHRVAKDSFFSLTDNYRIGMLHSCGYHRNISLVRLADHRGLARKFSVLAPRETTPDVILCSMPTIELSREAVRYARVRGVPVVLDIRDLWPEIFLDIAPVGARGLVRLLLTPLYQELREACRGATAVIGITDSITEWGVGHAGRSRTDLDRAFPLGYVEHPPLHLEMENAQSFWKSHGIGVDPREFTVCFFGTFGRQFDLETVIEAARRIDEGPCRIRFVLCGDGEALPRYRALAADLNNVVFPGWVGAAEIWTLMRMSRTGLAPYRNSKDFRMSLPNKSIEYLSAGLPMVSSLTGELENLLAEHGCGVTYADGDSESLVTALEMLYDDNPRLETMKASAIALYRKKFTAEKVYGELCDYLMHLALRRSKGEKGAGSVT